MIAKRLILSFIMVLCLTGCASKIPQTITQPLAGNYSLKQIETAIMKAGADRKWIMKRNGNNTISGSITNRGYRVTIQIPYTEQGYSIEYVSGEEVATGKVSKIKNYKRWSVKLNQSILAHLAKPMFK